MKIRPGMKIAAAVALSGVVFIFALARGKSGDIAGSEKFKRHNDDFDRFSAIRGEGNDTRPRPIADESAQKALAAPQTLDPAPGIVTVKPEPEKPLAMAKPDPKPEPKQQMEASCASAWDAGDACAKIAQAAPAVAASPVPEMAEPKTAAVASHQEDAGRVSSGKKTVRASSPRPKPNGVYLASTSNTVGFPATGASGHPPKRDLTQYEQQLLAMSSPNANVVRGRDVKSNTDILKKGSRYLGVINEAMVVRAGEKHDVTVDVVARLSNNTTVKPFLLYGMAELNKSGTRIVITVSDCIAADPSAESIPCKGVIQDAHGVTGLSGDLYNPAHYANALRVASAILGGGFMALKTTSRTLTGGVLYDQTFGNGVLDALAGASVQAGNDEASEIKSEGKRVEIAPGAIVQVLIGDDVSLW